MTRPYVSVNANNKIDEFLKHLETMLPAFKTFPGVIGITLNGGLSRGYADHLSEIYITLYLNESTFKNWQTSKAPVPTGIVKFDSMLYDVKFINFEEEEKREYSEVELWDLSYAKILYDRDGKLAHLIENKLAKKPNISDAEDYLWETYSNYKLAGDIWIYRDGEQQGHLMLNEAIKPLLKALYIANEEYTPHEKWLIHFSRTLNWTPENWQQKLIEATNTQLTLEKRQAVIESLFNEIDSYIKTRFYPEFPLAYHQKFIYDLLKRLVEKGSMPLQQWQQSANLFLLNSDPFYKITTIVEGNVVLNYQKLLSIKKEDMYSWHYEIVTEVIKNCMIKNKESEVK